MHILLIHQSYTSIDEPGGTRHHELARYLVDEGHSITIIASQVSYLTGRRAGGDAPELERPSSPSGSGSAEAGRVTVLRTYTYPALHRSFVHRLFSFFSFMASSFWAGLRVKDVDVVWGTSPPIFQGLTAWLVARLKGVPFLFEVRDLWPAFAVQVGVLRQPILIRLSERLERFLYQHANRLIVNSPGFVEHVKERGAKRVEVIPNGADPRMFDPQSDGMDFRRQHGLEGKYLVMYAGAHGLSNDLGVVLDAALQLHNQPEIVFVLLGDGKEKGVLIAKATDMKLTSVLFLPPIPKSGMSRALAASDVCVAILKPIPLYATVYPNKVFDYMAAGRPVVLAIDGVIKDVVERAGAGIPIPPGDPTALAQAIRLLSGDRQMGREMGSRGRYYVEAHFDRLRLAGQLSRQFQELIG